VSARLVYTREFSISFHVTTSDTSDGASHSKMPGSDTSNRRSTRTTLCACVYIRHQRLSYMYHQSGRKSRRFYPAPVKTLPYREGIKGILRTNCSQGNVIYRYMYIHHNESIKSCACILVLYEFTIDEFNQPSTQHWQRNDDDQIIYDNATK
jgi:hypothetical protein